MFINEEAETIDKAVFYEWAKFYPKKSYPTWRGKVIHTNKARKFFYPEELSQNKYFQRLIYYLTLPYGQKDITQNYAAYSTLLFH